MKVTVYCASSHLIDDKYFADAKSMALRFIEAKVKVLYGGGSTGLMGAVADVYVEQEGDIQGVIPQFMKDVEWAHKDVKDMVLTETMAERKRLLFADTDAIVALAGGTGTFEELFEVITLKRLGKFLKPIVILNTDGYYDHLIKLLEKCVEDKFMTAAHLSMWQFVNTPDEILPAIHSMKEWPADAIHYAVPK